MATGERVVIGMDPHKRSVTIEVMTASEQVLFRDATSGVTTYPANRQLVTPAPSPDGEVRIDFNRAYNMPCAYTDFATCPLPPAANTLPFAVDAGEKIPTRQA